MDFFNLKQGNKLLGKPHLLHVIYMSDTGLNALHKLPNLIFKTTLRYRDLYVYLRHTAGLFELF